MISEQSRKSRTTLDLLDIQGRIDELKLLRDGWLDGKGLPPAVGGLDWLADSFDAYYPDDLPLPYLFPTPEGRVLAEWSLKRWALSLEIDVTAKRGEWHALNLDTDAEESKALDLANSGEWVGLAGLLRNLIREVG